MEELKKENTFRFETREELDKVFEDLQYAIDTYGYVTVAYFYDLIGHESSYKSALYGWDTLSDFNITDFSNFGPEHLGPLLTVPAPKPIPNKETVNHPSHYQSETGIEVIDVIEAFTFDLEGVAAFDTGNILKYMCRWRKKNGLQDLKKAEWYLRHLITHIEKIEKENK